MFLDYVKEVDDINMIGLGLAKARLLGCNNFWKYDNLYIVDDAIVGCTSDEDEIVIEIPEGITHFALCEIDDDEYYNGFHDLNYYRKIKVINHTKSFHSCRTMFYDCRDTVSIDLTEFDTSNIDDMTGMFCMCHSLKEIIWGTFPTDKVKSMREMFYKCSSLELINLSGFSYQSVENMNSMFNYCTSLSDIKMEVSEAPHLKDYYSLFFSCNSLPADFMISFHRNLSDIARRR